MHFRRRTFLAAGSIAAAGWLFSSPRGSRGAEKFPAADPTSAAHHKLAAAYSAERKGVSLAVLVDGQTVFEDYPNGGRAERAWELASGTKSFCGVMAAAAAEDGLLALDEKVADTITEWQGDERRSVTLRQLLSLTSGLPGGGIGRPPPYAEAIETKLAAEPGTRFQYGPVPFQAFGELIRRKLAPRKEGVLEYLHRRLLAPVGIRIGSWRKGTDGQPHLPSGAALAAGEWAKFGELVRLGGAWNGKQLVPRERLDECFTATEANPAYGLTWWLAPKADDQRRVPLLLRREADTAGVAPDLVFAAGAGNQRLYVSRRHKLVVARQAEEILQALAGQRVEWSNAEFLARLLYGCDAAGKRLS